MSYHNRTPSIARRIILPIAVLIFLFGSRPVFAQDSIERAKLIDQQRARVIAKASAASICVFSPDGKGGGSGVIVTKDGFALTNYHVVKPCGPYMHCGMSDGSVHDAVIVGMDPTGDVALIKLLGRDDFPTAEIGDSDLVRTGDSCFAIGNPFLLATNFQPTVTWGIVSGTHRYQYPSKTLLEYTDCIQTDAAINPGNSGGPLFNTTGELIGINGRGSFEKRGRVNVGVGYAISINQIKLFWEHLNSGRVVDHASLGATVQTSRDGKVLVDRILESSNAYRRGLRYGDELIRFGGREIKTVNEFKNILGIYPKGWRVPLQYRRGEETFDIVVRLAALHTPDQLLERQSMDDSGKPLPKQASPQATIPSSAERQIELREGFANFHFNRVRLNEVWQSDPNRSILATKKSNWRITGSLVDQSQTAIRLLLDKDNSAIQWGESTAFLKTENLSEQRLPDGSGGLLVALHIWRKLIVEGPKNVGDSYYLGSLPIDERRIGKVVQCRFEGTQSNLLFDLESGFLVTIETWTDESLDPCVVQFGEFNTTDGISVPTRWTATCGNEFRWELVVDDFRFDGDQTTKGNRE